MDFEPRTRQTRLSGRGDARYAFRVAFVVCLLLVIPLCVVAQQRALPLRQRVTLGAATMISPSQTGRLGFDTSGVTSHLHFGYAPVSWFVLQLGVGVAGFPGPQGGLGLALSPTAGALVNLVGDSVRPFVYVDAGAAFTGPFVRPLLRGGVGIDVRVAGAFTLGPSIGYAQILQANGRGFSSDARFVELCLTLTLQSGSNPETVRETIHTQNTRVVHERSSRPSMRPLPPPSAPSVELEILLNEALPRAQVELLAPVLFKLGSTVLDPLGVAMLHEVARELNARSDIRLVEIQGYADSRGTDAFNATLSQRRAEQVLAWLVAHGVAPDRLRTAAHGEADPVEQTAATEVAHEQNRRVVFRVIEADER